MKKTQIFTIICCYIALAATTGCVDNKYDLGKEIDKKWGFGENGLILPNSNTSDMHLSQIIELKKNGQLTTDADGNYLFYKKGKSQDETIVCVGYGSICNTAENNYTYYFRQDSTLEITPKYPELDINTMRFTTSTSPNYKPDRLGEHVRALDYVDTPMSIVVEWLDNNIKDFAPYISKIKYSVPSYYVLEDENDLVATNMATNRFGYHVIRCKGVDFNAALAEGEVASYNNETGQISFKGDIKMDCFIDYAYMNLYDTISNPYINIRTTVGSLTTDRVTGRFEKRENVEMEPITFDDMPDLIKNEEVVIDIDNPIVRLTIDNEVPARALINATVKAYRNGTETTRLNIGEAYGTDSIKFEGKKTQTVWISRKPTEIPDSVSDNIVVDNIIDIMRIMPDKINIDGWAHTDSSQVVTMGLNYKYKVYPTYELVAPLVIGKNMKLVYIKETDDLHSKLDKLEINSLTMTASITNTIPLDLTTTLKAIDTQNREIKDIVLTQAQIIKGLSDTDITLTIVGKPEDFQKLDKLELKAYAESSEVLAGQTLNENQALRLENIKITIK
ncbi:MAG: hypothetical protein J1E57_02100 [Prevotella sp.]|nr:hypothetical protein [Prevotella sp.]